MRRPQPDGTWLALAATGALALASSTSGFGLRASGLGLRTSGSRLVVQGATPGRGKSSTYDELIGSGRRAFWVRGHGDQWTEAILAAAGHVGLPGLSAQIACGFFGCVFELPGQPDRVLKITGDPSDAAAWALIWQHRASGGSGPRASGLFQVKPALPSGFAEVDSVFAFPTSLEIRSGIGWDGHDWSGHRVDLPTGKRLYGIVYERLQPIAREKSFAIEDLFGPPSSYGSQERYRGLMLARWQHRDPTVARELARLREAIAWLAARGVTLHDIRYDNAMQDEAGRWKLTDLGVSEGPPVEIPELGLDFGFGTTLMASGLRFGTNRKPEARSPKPKARRSPSRVQP